MLASKISFFYNFVYLILLKVYEYKRISLVFMTYLERFSRCTLCWKYCFVYFPQTEDFSPTLPTKMKTKLGVDTPLWCTSWKITGLEANNYKCGQAAPSEMDSHWKFRCIFRQIVKHQSITLFCVILNWTFERKYPSSVCGWVPGLLLNWCWRPVLTSTGHHF